LSWRSPIQPLPKEIHPKLAFERLFSSMSDVQRAKRDWQRKSILDFVKQDSKDLLRQVSGNDVRKLNEYFSAIRDIELRIEASEKFPPIKSPDYTVPEEIPGDYQEHLQIMMDLIVLAFQADITRITTFVLADEGSNKPYPFIDISEGHHDLSHHGEDKEKRNK